MSTLSNTNVHNSDAKAAAQPANAGATAAGAVMGTYARQDIVFERGEGSWLIATDGTRYLDFASGIAVNAVGHCHPQVVAALTAQAQTLWHTSNLYRVANQETLAERLVARTFADTVFFCNSGAEACEGAIKTARRYHAQAGQPERWRTITFAGAFHGRTLAALAAGNNAKHLDGFGQPADGFDSVPFGDHEALEAAIGPETAAIMVEPVQGEGGIRVVPDQCLRGLRELCDTHGVLLIFDEVQTGVGRSGKLFAHEHSGITPDIMAIAKGIGGGFPLGAVLATTAAARGMTPGTHGSTFGGNPLATAVGNAVLDVVDADFLTAVCDKELRLIQSLAAVQDGYPDLVEEVRGRGLLVGLKVLCDPQELIGAAIEEHLLTVAAADNVVRLLPPLTISNEELSEACARLDRALARVRAARKSKA